MSLSSARLVQHKDTHSIALRSMSIPNSHLLVIVRNSSFIRVFSQEPHVYLLCADFVRYNDLNAATYILEEMLTYSHIFNLSGSINTSKMLLILRDS